MVEIFKMRYTLFTSIIFVIVFFLLVGLFYYINIDVKEQIIKCTNFCEKKGMEYWDTSFDSNPCRCLNSNDKLEEFWIK